MLSINWETKVITVPKDYTSLVQISPTEIRNMELNVFRLDVGFLIAGAEGMVYDDAISHNTEVILGGITYARIIEIINGYTVTFEDGQYAVNLIGANSNVGDVINVNQVSVRSQNSAGLISNQAIEFSSFNGGVTLDQNNSTGRASSGTVFPIGTPQVPVDNLADLHLIAQRRGFNKIFVLSNATLDDTASWEGHEFVGESAIKTVITVQEVANVLNCEFYECSITGTLDGNSQIERSVVNNLYYVNGFIFNCALGPSLITLGLGTTGNFLNCFSSVPGTTTPEMDMNSTGIVALRGYNGGMLFKNYSGSGAHSIDLISGQIKLDLTITSGTWVFRGVGKVIDASTGLAIQTGVWNTGVTIINELLNTTTISEAASFSDAIYIDAVNGSPGTTVPRGLERSPVDNLTDAITLAEIRGTSRLIFLSDYTFLATDVISGYDLIGKGMQLTTLTFTAGCIIAFCNAYTATLVGNLTGLTGTVECNLVDLGSVGLVPSSQDIIIRRSKFSGTTTLPSNYSGTISILNSYSDNAVATIPIVDAGNSTSDVLLDSWSGNVIVKNVTQGNNIAVRLSQGEIILDTSTFTNGNIHISGTGYLRDSGGNEILTGTWNTGVTVENETITGGTSFTEADIADAVWEEATADHQTAGTTGKALTDAGAAGNPWDSPIDANPTPGTYGWYMTKKLLTFAKWIGLR